MARINYVEADAAPREVADLFSVMKARSGSDVFNLWKTIAHVPAALPHMVKLGTALLAKGRLDAKLREMAIVRVATLLDCEYERRPHANIGLAVGMTEQQVAEVADWTSSRAFNEVERAVLRFTDEETQTARTSDATFAELAKHFDEGMMVELALVVAFYGMIGRVLLAFAVDPDTQQISSPSQLTGRSTVIRQ